MRNILKNTDNTHPGDYKNAPAKGDMLLHLAFDKSVQANFVISAATGKIVTANLAACKLLGYSLKEMITKTVKDIFDMNDGFARMLKERTVTGYATALVSLVKRNGRLLSCETTSAIFRDESGVEKATYTIVDINTSTGNLPENEDHAKEKAIAQNSANAEIHLLLADDHLIITTGLKLIIEHFIPNSIIDEVHDGASALEKIQKKSYDLLILDVNMPGTDPFILVSNILLMQPGLKILIFSMSDEELYARKYLELGVRGYIQKDEPAAEIKKAIMIVLNNKKYRSSRLSRVLPKNPADDGGTGPFDVLSPREREIARYLVRGQSVAVICQKLTLHPSTVSTFRTRIFKKLRCADIVALSTLAKVYTI